jgi:hypothetical protein
METVGVKALKELPSLPQLPKARLITSPTARSKGRIRKGHRESGKDRVRDFCAGFGSLLILIQERG